MTLSNSSLLRYPRTFGFVLKWDDKAWRLGVLTVLNGLHRKSRDGKLTVEAGEGVVIDQEKTQKYLVIRDAPELQLPALSNWHKIFPIYQVGTIIVFEIYRIWRLESVLIVLEIPSIFCNKTMDCQEIGNAYHNHKTLQVVTWLHRLQL